MDQPKIERMLRLMRLLASNTNYTLVPNSLTKAVNPLQYLCRS